MRFSQVMRLSLLIGVCLLLSVTVSAQKTRGIRSVDFRNFTYEADGSKFALRDGKYYEGDGVTWHSYALLRLQYLDFDRDGRDDAFVVVDFRTSGTFDHGQEYYVFAYGLGAARMIFHESREKPFNVRVAHRRIVIASPFWKNSGLCCPSGIETSVYIWRDARFIRVSHKRRYMDPNTNWWLTARRA
jgi:hypothetical protein